MLWQHWAITLVLIVIICYFGRRIWRGSQEVAKSYYDHENPNFGEDEHSK